MFDRRRRVPDTLNPRFPQNILRQIPQILEVITKPGFDRNPAFRQSEIVKYDIQSLFLLTDEIYRRIMLPRDEPHEPKLTIRQAKCQQRIHTRKDANTCWKC